ncbi:MAG TPA: helix-turn-helix transcriptional regulator [Pyrinomonadaceae bacterium]|jgi:transcriptional regulator with XRE-family HTH domain
MSFGKWLKEVRQKRGVTQKALAHACGVSNTYISRLEHELNHTKHGVPTRPALEIVDAIARSLDVSREEARVNAGYSASTPQHGFGQWLLEARIRRGLSQEKLAELCDVTAAYISLLEHEGKSKQASPVHASVAVVDKIARALEVPYEEARLAAGYVPPEMVVLATHELDIVRELRALPVGVQLDVEAEIEALYQRYTKVKELST